MFNRSTVRRFKVFGVALALAACDYNPLPRFEPDWPKAAPFNKYFGEMAKICGVAVPYVFKDGMHYQQTLINDNFEAILEAMKRNQCVVKR